MFGLFKKDSDRDFMFHKDRTKKLLDDAFEKFVRADQYLCGSGIGNDAIRMMSARGAAGKAQKVLQEAMYNANEAIRHSKGNRERLLQLTETIESIVLHDSTDYFVHPLTKSNWDETREKWFMEFKKLM